ncbi:Arginine exporter protein ArgO [Marinomonas aquimarina]|uniref:Arginine exporter protein ArgO n=1 Tax=Marinomonas aquimarina TaxID=295068 RepID=A0A1A8TND6_9GAMM|nr:LysE/ArgO family amino acid transporter [Marinomonas aquimarina]SBS34718.1 Arginine exporter protein ArgO [Marinomonas aquimarina]
MLTALLSGFTTGAGLIIAIGSQNAFVLRQGLLRQHIGIIVAITALSDILLISLGMAGIGFLIEQWPALLVYLQWGGAAFLGYYGLLAAHRAWTGAGALHAAQNVGQASLTKVVLTCLAFTFLNPHVYLDTMVLLGSLSTHYPGMGQITFAIGACSASVVWFCSLGFGARLLRPVFNRPLAWRILDAIIAVFMLILSMTLALS